MAENRDRLLTTLEDKIQHIISLCNRQKEEIQTLKTTITARDIAIENLNQQISDLTSKCDNMLTARVISVNQEELKNARSKLSVLVREVDKCIALLNE